MDYGYETKSRPAPKNASQDGFMHNNGRRLLANRETGTFIWLNDVLRQTSFR